MPNLKASSEPGNISRPEKLYRIGGVLERIPISKSSWWQGVKEGRYPPGFKLSPRVRVWSESDINSVIDGRTDFSQQ
jgi:prophage regulatory protein